MQFGFTGEQEEFRSVLRRFLEEKSPPTVVRRRRQRHQVTRPHFIC